MNNNFRLFPNIFSDVISVVRTEYDETKLTTPLYIFDTYKKLEEIHSLQNRSEKIKYPLVWLVWEASQNVQSWSNSSMYSISPRIFIINGTRSEYLGPERYTKNFEAVLYPIWWLIHQAINDSDEISYFSGKKFKVSEHFFWGKTVENQKNTNALFDTLDALEIRFDELKVTPGDC